MSTSTSDAAVSVPASRRSRRWPARLVITLIVLAALYYAGKAFVSVFTNVLWFDSVDHGSVYTRRLLTQIVLFAIFGGLTVVAVGANLVVASRRRPGFNPHPTRQRWRSLYLAHGDRWRRWLIVAATFYFAVSVGSLAASSWQTWLAWRNAVPFHHADPQFHRDISYFLFTYPLHRLVLTLLFRIVTICIVLTAITRYLYGGLRLRGDGPRLTRAATAQLSLLLGLYLVLKAFAYWLDRFGLATSNRGVVTGPGYTDVHIMLPDKLILLVVAALAAVLLLANVALRQPRLVILGLGGMTVAAFLLGIALPAIVQQFRDKPSASSLELPYIQHNIDATRSAFGVSGVTARSYAPAATTSATDLAAQAKAAAQVRLLDPNQFSSTFTAKQQVQSYYGFKSTLDVDRYSFGGPLQDVVLAVRELSQSGLPNSQKTWTNTHLVYTHGYGVVAAPTSVVTAGDPPHFVEGDLPPRGALSITTPQIYYGQMSPGYSIVGGKSGTPPKEFDLPPAAGSPKTYSTYQGGGGIKIGSHFRRLVYAVKYRSTSILLSKEINDDSQLLTVRNPRSRVAAVAPWLTLDGDVYPVVSGGRILWVVDGYTTASNYPYSQSENLKTATTNTLTVNGSTVTQPSTSINYMRNSVKATVDAYTGKVTLYAWGQSPTPDPVLQTWEKAFPHLVQPQTAIPADLLGHLRYPQDLFNMQRYVLTQYHVTNPQEFYSGSDFWKVPADPTVGKTTTTNSIGKTISVAPPTQPSTYMTLSPDGTQPAHFSLSSGLVSLNKRNLAGFLAVDSQPGPEYGHFTLLKIPTSNQIDAPAQVQAGIEGDKDIQPKFSLLRNSNNRVVYGNQLEIPLGGQILYVEPAYTQSTGANSFPIFQYVIARYGGGPPVLAQSLDGALDGALGAKGVRDATTTTNP